MSIVGLEFKNFRSLFILAMAKSLRCYRTVKRKYFIRFAREYIDKPRTSLFCDLSRVEVKSTMFNLYYPDSSTHFFFFFMK